jgi:hypothetical protein
MPAYLVYICQGVSDRKELETYWKEMPRTFRGFDVKLHTAYCPFELLEGERHLHALTWPRLSRGAFLCYGRALGDYGMLLDIHAAIARKEYEDRRRVCQPCLAPPCPGRRNPRAPPSPACH